MYLSVDKIRFITTPVHPSSFFESFSNCGIIIVAVRVQTEGVNMRKYVVIAFFVVFGVVTGEQAYAQLKINPIFGLNFFSISKDPPGTNSEVGVGFNIGANLRVDNGQFYFQPGLHYQRQGFGLNIDTSAQTYSAKININSVRVPLLVGLKLIPVLPLEVINVNIHGGIAPTFLLSATDNSTGANVTDQYNSVSLGGVIGVGVELFFITVDVDYEYGFLNFYNQNKVPASTTGYDGKPTTIHANLGVKFGI